MKKILVTLLLGLMFISYTHMITDAEEYKYQELYDYLEAGDYDSAITYIQNLKVDNAPSLPEDLSEYLLEVEITEDNFDDYFEWTVVHPLNAFGEEDANVTWGDFASKMYAEGYYLYQIDDIPVEYRIGDWNSASKVLKIDNLGGTTQSGPGMSKECEIIRTGIGHAVYIRKDAVTIRELEDSRPGGWITFELIIKHGNEEEKIYRSYLPGLEY